MLTKVHTGLDAVPGVWWKPAHKSEKIWVGIAFVWCMILFAMMPLWHWKGGQNPSGIRRRVDPQAFYARTVAFATQHQIGDDRGVPIVAPPAGSDIYLTAMAYQWYPILQLEKDKEYILHLSALDVNHGFSLYPLNVNFQVIPGYDYGLRVTPTASGDFRIICNEFCGIGHHTMVGRMIVVDAQGEVVADNAAASVDGEERK
ncbi:MAG: cytochrome c oxidase subunit II [Gemmatimonas sp.]|nr:cytochrome c oxidase subunit II [Gemmatimonas sp.]